MKQSLIIRGVIILAGAALAISGILPLSEKISLGLDLQGGMHLVLGVETSDALRAETDTDKDRFVERLKEEGVATAAAERRDVEGAAPSFVVTGVPADQSSTVDEVHSDFFSQVWQISQGDEGYVLTMRENSRRELRNDAVEQAMRTIRNRVDEFGVAEPVIQRQGFTDSDRIVVQLPGVEDPERVKRLINRTAFLEWRFMDFPREGTGGVSRAEIEAHYAGNVPSTVEILEGDLEDATGAVVGTSYFGVERSAVVTGRDLKNARVGAGQFNEPVVEFMLAFEKGQDFGQATTNNIGRGMAIVLDGKVLSAPSIRGRIEDRGQIEGGFSYEEATDLSTALKSGALPAGITILEERTVGPSLGQDSIDQGLRAGLYGAGLVLVMMLIVYLVAGFNANLALALNVVLVFSALAAFGATLTLPGIAGIILTIGMAVDANVLVFERIREELRAGRTVKNAVATGFEKALSSIVDANITTLIAALFLYEFGSGPIRGFAVTLSVGIFGTLITSVFVSRFLFDLWLSRRQQVERLYI
ncbi:MAG: protein translocase subunit SecD [Acidobacteriota bacterium]